MWDKKIDYDLIDSVDISKKKLINYSELHTVRYVSQAAKSQLKCSRTLTFKLLIYTLIKVLFPL